MYWRFLNTGDLDIIPRKLMKIKSTGENNQDRNVNLNVSWKENEDKICWQTFILSSIFHAYEFTATEARLSWSAPEPKADSSLIIGRLIKTSNHDMAGTKKFSNHSLELNLGLIQVVARWSIHKHIGQDILHAWCQHTESSTLLHTLRLITL